MQVSAGTLKVLITPKAELTELKEHANWKHGAAVWLMLTFAGLAIYAAAEARLGTGFIPIDFGAGLELLPISILTAMAKAFATLFIFIAIAHYVAKALGGQGNLETTFGLACYEQMLAPLMGLTAAGLQFKFVSMRAAFYEITTTGTIPDPFAYFGIYTVYLSVAVAIFTAWALWIRSAAVSASHDLPYWKGILSVVLAFAAIGLVNLGISFI
jgi:hypothetical protein